MSSLFQARSVPFAAYLNVGFFLVLLGASVLPLLPGWMGLTTLLAGLWVVTRPMPATRLVALSAALLLPHAVYVFAWLSEVAANPASFFIGGLLHPFGQPFGTLASGCQLAGQAVLAAALAYNAWQIRDPWFRSFVGACFGFVVWTVLSSAWSASFGPAPRPDIVLAAGAVWANWAVVALLTAALVAEARHNFIALLVVVTAAAAMIAIVLLVQLAVGDYSYVLVTAWSDEIFTRVRGPYYYHAPPVQYIAVMFPIAAVMLARSPRGLLLNGALAALGLALVFNGTRGISLAASGGIAVYIAFFALTGRAMSRVVAISLVVMALAVSDIAYVKPGSALAPPPQAELSGPDDASKKPDVAPEVPPQAELSVSDHTPEKSGVAADMPTQTEPKGSDNASKKPDVASEVPPQAVSSGSDGASDIAPDRRATASDIVSSNSYRLNLAIAGLQQVLKHPVLGTGPGYAELLMPSNQSNKQRFETSSHILAIDVAVMGGLPALLALASIFTIPALGAICVVIGRPRSQESLLLVGVVTALGVFLISTVFHPQEHSYIILLLAALAGALAGRILSLGQTESVETAFTKDKKNVFALGAGVLGLGLSGWLIVTSPSYVFPVIEFVGRFGQELREQKTAIYTTDPALNRILGWVLPIAGVVQKPALLADDPARLPVSNSFLLWRPADERRYPALRENLGPSKQRRYGQWLSVEVLPSWSLLKSYQPTVEFIRVGPWLQLPVALSGNDMWTFERGTPRALMLSKEALHGAETAYLHFEGPEDSRIEVEWHDESLRPGEKVLVRSDEFVEIPPAQMSHPSFTVTGLDAPGAVRVSGLLRTMPSITRFASARLFIGGEEMDSSEANKIMDLSDQSDIAWVNDQELVLELDFATPVALAGYRIAPQFHGPSLLPAPLQWRAEANIAGKGTVVLDQQKLSSFVSPDLGFAFPTPQAARHYRFVFPAAAGSDGGRVTIRELELFPVASTTAEEMLELR